MIEDNTSSLRKRIKDLEIELKSLKELAKQTETKTTQLTDEKVSLKHVFVKCDLSNEHIQRYSRQIILPEIAVQGQCSLTKSSALVVGTGGLGCPAAQYLTAAGIGTLGLVDYDNVELSNLHRQLLHKEDAIGLSKVESAISDLKRLNSSVILHSHHIPLSSDNAFSVIQKYDVILDCTDNVATRYLLNDACVLLNKPLISGSALRFEGQLTVYNMGDGPCYRCLYPVPPPAETVTNCSDGGVIGAVTGVIGALQALEAIKIFTHNNASFNGSMLLFDGFGGTFRNIRLRGKQPLCEMCGEKPTIKQLQDYEQFCGASATDKVTPLPILAPSNRITAQEYAEVRDSEMDHLLIDVRPKVEFEICHLTGATNIPLNQLLRNEKIGEITKAMASGRAVFVICKRGNDSQKAVIHMHSLGRGTDTKARVVKDITGGLHGWHQLIDSNFPFY